MNVNYAHQNKRHVCNIYISHLESHISIRCMHSVHIYTCVNSSQHEYVTCTEYKLLLADKTCIVNCAKTIYMTDQGQSI